MIFKTELPSLDATLSTMTPFWSEAYRIRFYEVEPTGRLSVPSLCRYLQQTADSHCRSAGVSLQQLRGQGRMWVIVRMRLFVFFTAIRS